MRNPLRPTVALTPDLSAQVDDVSADIRATLDDVRTTAAIASVAFAAIAVVALVALFLATSGGGTRD